jgi:hypothetical protein
VRLVPALSLVGLLALAPLCGGCGGGHDLAEKQLADLRGEITRLRASQAAMAERLDAIEIERGSFQKGAASAAPGASPAPGAPPAPGAMPAADGDRPSLDVVRLSPSEGDGDADLDGQRQVIRASGSDGSIQKAPRGSAARAPQKKGVAAVATPKKAPSDTDPRPTAKP